MDIFRSNNYLFPSIWIGLWFAEGLEFLWHIPFSAKLVILVGLIFICPALLAAIFVLLEIKKVHNSFFNHETSLFILRIIIMVPVFISLQYIFSSIFKISPFVFDGRGER